MRTGMPDLYYTIDDMIVEGDRAASRCTLSGTYSGKIGDTEVKDKKINITQAIFARVEEDKIVEGWAFSDSAILYQQLGINSSTG